MYVNDLTNYYNGPQVDPSEGQVVDFDVTINNILKSHFINYR